MIQTFISHAWKESFRSPIWAKNLLANIFLGFVGVMLMVYAIMAGVGIAFGLEEVVPGKDPVELINSLLLYYFFFEFMIRFFLQNVPVLSIQPYLHLPIKKSQFLHFMLRKSQVSVFNLLAIFLFAPTAIVRVGREYGALTGLLWLVMIIGMVFTIHFLGILFKKKLNDMPNLLLGMVIIFAALGALDYFQIVSFSMISDKLFGAVLAQPAFAAIPVALWLLFYRLNYIYLSKNTYPEEISTKKNKTRVSGDFAFLKRFGRIGELIALELKLIIRHKRPRNTLVMSGLLLFYGLIFYTQDIYMEEMSGIFLLAGIFVTGAFFINHGQFLLSWESGYFDFVLIRKMNLRQYFEAKYYMFVTACTIAFVASLGYAYFGVEIILFNLAAYLFNIGVNIPFVMRIAMFNPKKIDLNKGAAFNYEGVGAAQFLIAIPVLGLPYLFYGPLLAFGYGTYGLLLVALIGLIGFLLRNKVIDYITKSFTENRHKIAAGFRAQ
ncbi:DUF5687 family protein [Roseivirga sp. E12]|uniref:DUF5687 family protein n=1 Tax=Roseivirga sp. E12 TaxID=2819237 RepID=UPI001ABC17EA|nr:DUF5687 family protein [Roseivirga sp. E12]MBO3698797.1 hypothetical protein [Roseivirga sp. E12]